MSGRRSQYNEISIKQVPRRKRTIQMPGSQEWDGKWGRCWYCGQINNIDTNAIGEGDGMTYSVTVQPNVTYQNGETVLNMQNSGRTVLIQDTGLIFTERHDISGTATSGCRFCGSRNWR